MTSNFDYEIIMQARKSKTFRELDDKVRLMSLEIGKGNKQYSLAEYKKIKKQRDDMLNEFVIEQASLQQPAMDKSLYQKIDTQITRKLDAFIAKFPNTKLKNIVLQGPTGTGKTYCSKIIANELQAKNFNVHFTSTFNLVKRMNDNMYGQDHNVPTDFFESSLLIIDDLGVEPTIKNSDEFLYTVINERYTNNKPFIITTNLSTEQLLNHYDERLFGRIFDKARTAVITFQGKDLRIE